MKLFQPEQRQYLKIPERILIWSIFLCIFFATIIAPIYTIHLFIKMKPAKRLLVGAIMIVCYSCVLIFAQFMSDLYNSGNVLLRILHMAIFVFILYWMYIFFKGMFLWVKDYFVRQYRESETRS